MTQTTNDPHLSLSRLGRLCGLFLLVMLSLKVWTARRSGELATPIAVELTGFGGHELADTTAWSYDDHTYSEIEATYDSNGATRILEGVMSRGIRLRLPATAVRPAVGLVVRVGNQEFPYRDGAWIGSWREVSADQTPPGGGSKDLRVFDSPPSLRGPESDFPGTTGIINWAGDRVAVTKLPTWPWVPLTLAVFFAGAAWSRWGRGRHGNLLTTAAILPPPRAAPSERRWLWLAAGFLGICAALAGLEARQPAYFVQDDNHSQFMPVILYSAEAAEKGVFPVWDPYQFLGAPTASVGVYALTYPPTYLSYELAKHVLGEPGLTLDVFCVLHTLLGYFACFWCAREFGLRPSLSALGATCCVLSGYQLIAGRSWYYMTPFVVYFPLLVISVERLTRLRRPVLWVIGTGATIGAFFHAGNAQMWAYGVGAWGLAVLGSWLGGRVSLREVLWCVPAGLLGLAIVAPLLVIQLDFLRDVARTGGWGWDVSHSLSSVLFPYPMGRGIGPPAGPQYKYAGEVFYSGTVFAAATFFLIPLFLMVPWTKTLLREVVGHHVWLGLAVLSFVVAMGDAGGLWTLMSSAPMLNKFAIPLKFIALFNLLSVLAGGRVLEVFLSTRRSPAFWELVLVIAVATALWVHVTNSFIAFYWFADRPYPAPDARLATRLDEAPARLAPVAPDRCELPFYTQSCRHNWATVYRFFSAGGYDPLVAGSEPNRRAKDRILAEPPEAGREFGIRWYVVHEAVDHPVFSSNPGVNSAEILNLDEQAIWRSVSRVARRRETGSHVAIWELEGARPLAFAETRPEIGVPFSADARGITIDLAGEPEGGRIVANFLWRPQWKAFADGRQLTPAADSWGRLVADVPAGTRRLEFVFSPPWQKGFVAACGLLFAAIVSGAALSRWYGPRAANPGIDRPPPPRP